MIFNNFKIFLGKLTRKSNSIIIAHIVVLLFNESTVMSKVPIVWNNLGKFFLLSFQLSGTVIWKRISTIQNTLPTQFEILAVFMVVVFILFFKNLQILQVMTDTWPPTLNQTKSFWVLLSLLGLSPFVFMPAFQRFIWKSYFWL